jgi:hypothetical protein
MKRMRTSRGIALLSLCFGAWGTVVEPAHAGVGDVFTNEPPATLAHPLDAFMQRIESHLQASPYNFVTAYVTLHTPGWANNNFTAFAEVPLDPTLHGAARYVFSDRLGYPWGTVVNVPAPFGGFPSHTPATMHFDPYQAEGDTLSIDLGYSNTGGVRLGLWNMELTNYTVSPNANIIFGYLNGNPDWIAVVSVSLDRHPIPPR